MIIVLAFLGILLLALGINFGLAALLIWLLSKVFVGFVFTWAKVWLAFVVMLILTGIFKTNVSVRK